MVTRRLQGGRGVGFTGACPGPPPVRSGRKATGHTRGQAALSLMRPGSTARVRLGRQAGDPCASAQPGDGGAPPSGRRSERWARAGAASTPGSGPCGDARTRGDGAMGHTSGTTDAAVPGYPQDATELAEIWNLSTALLLRAWRGTEARDPPPEDRHVDHCAQRRRDALILGLEPEVRWLVFVYAYGPRLEHPAPGLGGARLIGRRGSITRDKREVRGVTPPQLSVSENATGWQGVYLGHEPRRRVPGLTRVASQLERGATARTRTGGRLATGPRGGVDPARARELG